MTAYAALASLNIEEPGPDVEPSEQPVATRQEQAAEIVDALNPAGFAVRHRLLETIVFPPDGKKVLIQIIVRDGDATPVETAASRTFKARDLDLGIDTSVDFLEAASRRSKTIEPATLASAFASYDVVITVRTERLGGTSARLVDQTVDLTALVRADVEAALRRRFDGDGTMPIDFAWPHGSSLAVLNVACAKTTSFNDALTLLAAMADDEGNAVECVGLDDLRGYGEAGTWARQLATDLTAFGDGRLAWRDVDAGILVSGPPGTGKSTLARHVAAAAGVPLVATSYSAWQQHGDGHLGDVLKGLRTVFEDAAARAPCILFIDEFDAFPARGRDQSYSGWFWPIVNALLEHLDGRDDRRGVVVMAACNHPEQVDPALTRPGRLNRHVEIGLPSAIDLSHILSQKLDGAVAPDVLLQLATALAGRTSGADATGIARDARRRAREAGREVSIADVEAVAMPLDVRSQEDLRRIAIHEAGHVLVALQQGLVPLSVSLRRSPGVEAMVAYPRESRPVISREGHHEGIVRALAGRAAEEVLLGCVSAGSGGSLNSDLSVATRTATAMAGLLGFDTLVYDPTPERRQVEAILARAYADATALLIRRQDALEALTELLVDRRTLAEADLRAFAATHGLTTAEVVRSG